MVDLIAILLLLIYLVPLLGLCLYAAFQPYILALNRRQKGGPRPAGHYDTERTPYQVIQLPVYNEDPGMVSRLLDSASRLRYPHERLIIQLLDDSTDPAISRAIQEHIARLKTARPGLNLFYLHRPSRQEFKAGNLKYGLAVLKAGLTATGFTDWDQVIVSIFDADFIIPEDFAEQTVPHFTDPRLGAIQTRLGYANQDASALTAAEAVFLKNLHQVDFRARSRAGHLTTFLGSAGSWRLSAIEQSGGWQGETQIEDVDLSFAAQIEGWRILYLDEPVCDSELPTEYLAFKSQQRSWMKGVQEVFCRRAGTMLKSRNLSLGQKLLGLEFFTVLSLQPLYMVLFHLLAVPAFLAARWWGLEDVLRICGLGLFVLALATHLPFLTGLFGRGQGAGQAGTQDGFGRLFVRLMLMPSLFVAVSYGLLEGLLGAPVHRERTLKGGQGRSPEPAGRGMINIFLAELFMAAYSIFLIILCLAAGEWVGVILFGWFVVAYPWTAVVSATELGLIPGKRP